MFIVPSDEFTTDCTHCLLKSATSLPQNVQSVVTSPAQVHRRMYTLPPKVCRKFTPACIHCHPQVLHKSTRECTHFPHKSAILPSPPLAPCFPLYLSPYPIPPSIYPSFPPTCSPPPSLPPSLFPSRFSINPLFPHPPPSCPSCLPSYVPSFLPLSSLPFLPPFPSLLDMSLSSVANC